MPQALIFDWGGVLMRTIDIRPRLEWERKLGLPMTGLSEAFFGSSAWKHAQVGQGTAQDGWNEVGQELNLEMSTLATVQRDFWAGDRLDQEMVTLIDELRDEGSKVALLSNFSTDLVDLLSDLEMDNHFDVTIISALEEVAKPDPEIYRRVLGKLQVPPAEAVFVDDWRPNVWAARELGINGIRFRGVPHLRRALAEAGLNIDATPPESIPDLKAVIFDWGGVLQPLTFSHNNPAWEQKLGLPEGTMNRVLWGLDWKRLEVGSISQTEYDDRVARGLGLADRHQVRQFYQDYYAGDRLDQRVIETIRQLRGRYRVAMLTNAFAQHAELLTERFGFDPRIEFDVYVNSAQVGLAKPDPAIYHLTLERLEVAPSAAILIDDQVRNTDSARDMGLNAVTFVDSESGLAELEALLGHPITS